MNEPPPRISAILCTHNRADYLERALKSLAEQALPPEQFEVVVVDNASTDRTAEVSREWIERLSHFHYVREDRLGLSQARNRGIAASRAPYLAYLDDDTRADRDWLKQLLHTFEVSESPPACIGGRVWLDWETGAPAWLPARYYSLYTFVDYGTEERLLGEHEYLVGANLAFRRDALVELGGFDTNLGRKGSMLLSGEESAIVNRLRQRGLPVYYCGSAVVWHAVPPARRRRLWLWKRMFWDGASQPLLDSGTGRSFGHYLRQGYLDVRRMARFALEGCLALVAGDRSKRLEAVLAFIQRAGRLRTHLLLAAGKFPNKSSG
ncbi:MAG: glycosyltransferase family 2 protein [Gemmataceae bacterium]